MSLILRLLGFENKCLKIQRRPHLHHLNWSSDANTWAPDRLARGANRCSAHLLATDAPPTRASETMPTSHGCKPALSLLTIARLRSVNHSASEKSPLHYDGLIAGIMCVYVQFLTDVAEITDI